MEEAAGDQDVEEEDVEEEDVEEEDVEEAAEGVVDVVDVVKILESYN